MSLKTRRWKWGAALVLLSALGLGAGCGGDDTTGSGGASPTGSAAGGSGTGTGTGGSGAQGGSGCAVDCSSLATGPCEEAVCNDQTGQCEIDNLPDGAACDDGQFCTLGDACDDGACAGLPNTCGITDPCMDVSCSESTQDCSSAPKAEGADCFPGGDLCMLGATCQSGSCVGGAPNDCYFAPLPDVCHVAECNPTTGECDATPDPTTDGYACVDLNDLCMMGKRCVGGSCAGGVPRCDHLSSGCTNGVCDPQTGGCSTEQVSPGQECFEATDACNQGVCQAGDSCVGQPANDGASCSADPCMAGQTCSGGTCQGGSPVTTCSHNDGCCPSSCDLSSDNDCGQIYHGDFVSGAEAPVQCADWSLFRASLTDGPYTSVTIRGQQDPTGRTCTSSGPTGAANRLCQALRTGATESVSCGGFTWAVQSCTAWWSPYVEITASGATCTCTNPGYTVRPCRFYYYSKDWGGANTATCNGPTQWLEVLCEQ